MPKLAVGLVLLAGATGRLIGEDEGFGVVAAGGVFNAAVVVAREGIDGIAGIDGGGVPALRFESRWIKLVKKSAST